MLGRVPQTFGLFKSTRMSGTMIDSGYFSYYSCGKLARNLMFRVSVWVKSHLPDIVNEVRVWNSILKWK